MYHVSMVRRTLALVAGPNGLRYNNGRHYNTVPAGLLYDIPRLLNGFARELDGPHREGVIIIAGVKPDDITEDTWKQARADGWNTGRPGSWVSCWRTAGAMVRVHIGFLDVMDQSRTPLFRTDQDHADIALLLGQYHELTGGPFHATAGVSGHGAIRELCKPPRARAVSGGTRVQAAAPKWMSDATHEQKYLRGAGPLIWKASTPDMTGPQAVLHTYDVNAQYLAAARNARVALDDLVHTGAAQQFDPTLCGYWLISANYVTTNDRLSNVMPPIVRGTGQTWVTTPIMEYLHQRHGGTAAGAPRVLDSFTAPGKTVLRPWAEKVRAARAELVGEDGGLGGQLLTAVKATYTQSMGLLGRPGGRIYRRDWYDTIVDMARVNLLRRIDKTYDALGEAPIEVNVDAVTYRTVLDANALGLHLGVGDGIGQFKHVSTVAA